MFYVYVLKSQKEEWLYIGLTSDLPKRIKAHNSGKARSTKSRKPYLLVYNPSIKLGLQIMMQNW